MISCWYVFNIFVDGEDDDDIALERFDLENFGFPYA